MAPIIKLHKSLHSVYFGGRKRRKMFYEMMKF